VNLRYARYQPISDKLIRLDGMLWTLCVARKPAICAFDGCAINKGDQALRPITNGQDRMKRINAKHYLADPA
jgi:hypothetical protein